jgi:serine/threonine protein kinase
MEQLCHQCGNTVDTESGNPCPECGTQLALSTDATMCDETKVTKPKPAAIVPAHQRVGRFQIIKPIGRGGMGNVFSAKEPVTNTIVALKMLKDDLAKDPYLVESFLREARHMYQLSHPSILKVLEVSEPSISPFFVMPMAAGGSLAEKVQKQGALPDDETLELSIQIAEGLAYAHSKGLIHRDLKPANVLLNEDGRALITDFGLVRPFHSDSLIDLKHQMPEGTPAYMSPTIAAGQVEDTRCDIYSFGALLYELLTGHIPYQGQTAQAVLEMVKKGPPPAIASKNPQANKSLVTISETCMARELRDRYASMDDVLADLRSIQAGKPLQGIPTKKTTPTRNKWIGSGIIIAVAISGFLIAQALKEKPADQLVAPRRGPADPTPPAQLKPNTISEETLMEKGDRSRLEGRPREATEAYRQILTNDPNHIKAQLALIEMLTQLGHIAPAKHETQLWLNRDPNNETAQKLMEQLETMAMPAQNRFGPPDGQRPLPDQRQMPEQGQRPPSGFPHSRPQQER